MTIGEILAGAREGGGAIGFDVPADWMQGRTVYGGLTAAIALRAARLVAPDAPPLRSAQIAFVGPVGGDVTARAAVLRQGRLATSVGVELTSGLGFGLRATLLFAAERASSVAHAVHATPDVPRPEDCPDGRRKGMPNFAAGFDYRVAGFRAGVAELLLWVRLRARDGLAPVEELAAIGDALPPAVVAIATDFGPLSSMNWSFNIHSATPASADGWWLLRVESEHAGGGITGERRAIWSSDGERVVEGLQSLALFF